MLASNFLSVLLGRVRLVIATLWIICSFMTLRFWHDLLLILLFFFFNFFFVFIFLVTGPVHFEIRVVHHEILRLLNCSYVSLPNLLIVHNLHGDEFVNIFESFFFVLLRVPR